MKTTSPKQIAANRRNAAKSTGPRTGEGLSVSKMNALKHGILSRQVLVRGLSLRESETELEALHQRFRDELLPEGPLEELLVDQIVTAHWRLRRALSAESAEIALSVDKVSHRHGRGFDPAFQGMRYSLHPDPAYALEDSSMGLSILMEWLREVRDRVKRKGCLSEAAVLELAARFGGKPNRLVRFFEDLRRQWADEPGQARPERVEDPISAILEILDRRLSLFRYMLSDRKAAEAQAEAAEQAAAVLPAAEVLDKIMRYETKLERQMYRAMAQLERVQRMRRGKTIPAPLSVEVSERG